MQLSGTIGRFRQYWLALGCLVAGLALVSCHRRQTVPPAPWPSLTTPWVPESPQRSRRPPSVEPPGRSRGIPSESSAPWRTLGPARPWKYIVLHPTASGHASVASIDAKHRQRRDDRGRPWLGIGYHFVIGNGNGMRDGQTAATFRWVRQLQGAHAGNRQYNELGIGVVLIGDFEQTSPTARQREAAYRLVQALRRDYQIPAERVVAHRDIRNTKCPGRNFPFEEIAGRAPLGQPPLVSSLVADH